MSDHFFRGRRLPGIGFFFIEDLIADVAFQKLGHQAIHGSPRSAHLLQNLRAIALFGKGACERFYLALDTLSPKNQLFFVLDGVTHLYYTPYCITIPLVNRTSGECMSIPKPLEKLDAKAFLPADGQERPKQVTPSLTEHNTETPSKHAFEWAELLRIVFVALAAAAVWFRVWEPFPRLIIGILATLIGGYPDDQRLCGAMRCAECSCHYELFRHGVVREH
jgi:hypothetical protein